MKVNFVDLKAQYLTIKKEIDEAILQVIDHSAFSSGPFVKSFERNFADAHQARYCLGVNSGTSALHIALWASGVEKGDEVIVPANTFFATAEAVSLCSANPVFVDCEPDSYNIDPQRIKEAITSKTRAIIAVHLYGQPAQMDEIKTIAYDNNILLVEDCAQAHLAEYKGEKVGTCGDLGCFSFYPGKNLGAYGEAGAVVTNNKDIYEKMCALRDHGSFKKYYHDFVGHNYRMDGIQAAVLDVKLRYLSEWTTVRRNNADIYRHYLKNIKEIILPHERSYARHVYHLFVLRVLERDRLIEHLEKNNIFTGIHYPVPCHLQRAYIDTSINQCPLSEKYAKEILSLPMNADLTENEIQYVCQKIGDFYKS